jgi:hypothetical protein
MHSADQLERLNAEQLREFAARLITELSRTRREVSLKQLRIDQLTHEMAILKRWKFAARSEQLHGEHRHLFEETSEADLEAIGLELEALKRSDEKAPPKEQPRRAPLPAHLPPTEVRHEPDSTTCACGCAMKRIGEDVSEKLEYTPGVFSVERHVRGKWACVKCQTITQAPVPAHVIESARRQNEPLAAEGAESAEDAEGRVGTAHAFGASTSTPPACARRTLRYGLRCGGGWARPTRNGGKDNRSPRSSVPASYDALVLLGLAP